MKAKMTNIRESAHTYESPETKNITELKKIDVNIELVPKTFKEGTPDEFTVNTFMVGEEEYRCPDSVLKQLKEQLANKPDLEFFKVTKTGAGMQTSYTVITL